MQLRLHKINFGTSLKHQDGAKGIIGMQKQMHLTLKTVNHLILKKEIQLDSHQLQDSDLIVVLGGSSSFQELRNDMDFSFSLTLFVFILVFSEKRHLTCLNARCRKVFLELLCVFCFQFYIGILACTCVDKVKLVSSTASIQYPQYVLVHKQKIRVYQILYRSILK